MNKQLTVIGGGAAGMMVAICACRGTAVTLLEPNERLGKPTSPAKGRCNVTNDAGWEGAAGKCRKTGGFWSRAFSRFDGRGTMAFFFEELGVPLKGRARAAQVPGASRVSTPAALGRSSNGCASRLCVTARCAC